MGKDQDVIELTVQEVCRLVDIAQFAFPGSALSHAAKAIAEHDEKVLAAIRECNPGIQFDPQDVTVWAKQLLAVAAKVEGWDTSAARQLRLIVPTEAQATA